MKRSWLNLAVFLVQAFGACWCVRAEDAQRGIPAPDQGPAITVQALELHPPASPAELERAIRNLSQPSDDDQISQIVFGLSRLEDSRDQERLQTLLDEQMRALTEMATVPPQPGLESATLGEQLIMRIEMLNLGPNATADDLRTRDRLVSEVAGIRDPVVRDQLLTRLEEKERQEK